MKRKLKQRCNWRTMQPMSTKQTMTYISPQIIEHKNNNDIYGRVIPVNGILHL